MKISKIEIVNILGLARADLDLKTPLLLVAGMNEAGKSTLSDAISMAVLGTPRRVKLKKELGQLLHDGAAKGRVSLMDEAGEVIGDYKLPKGDHITADGIKGAEYLPFLLDPGLFARLADNERRAMLFKLTNCKASPQAREEKLLARGCDPELVAEFRDMLRGSFESCAADAKERASQLKGAWRSVTGENWGSEKSEGWAQAVPIQDVDPAKIEEASAELAETIRQIGKGNAYIGSLEQRQRDAAGLAERRQQLEDLAGTLKRATVKKEVTDKDLAKWEASLADLTERLKIARTGSTPVACPCCAEKLRIVGNHLEKFDGAEADPKLAAELNGELIKAQDAVKLLRNTQANDAKAIKAADDATTQLGILQEEQGEPVTEEQLTKANEAITTLHLKRDTQQARVLALGNLLDEINSAETNTKRATEYHEGVKGWLKIADALAPSGIPAEILNSALAPVNDALAILAGMSSWKPVVIGNDMEITVGGRPYGLVSESSKWRTDALLALAIAQISELHMVVLDRYDVLDGEGRKQLLRMLRQLGKIEAMDTMIVCGTMVSIPQGLPADIQTVWINNAIAETA